MSIPSSVGRARAPAPTQWRAAVGPIMGVVCGIVIGRMDQGAADVQGPLLLLMVASFALTAARASSSLVVAAALAVGFAIGHLGTPVGGGIGGIALMAIVAAIACFLAAFVGLLAREAVGHAARALPRGGIIREVVVPTLANENRPWFATAAGSRWLLGATLLFGAIALAAVVDAGLVAASERTPLWLAIVWSCVSLCLWLLLAPAWIKVRVEVRGIGTALRLAGSSLLAAAAHATILIVTTIALLVRPEAPMMLWRIAFVATLPIDVLVATLIQLIAFASDADRFRERARRESEMRDAEYRAARDAGALASLRAQLQPHFFLNALNSATTLVRRGDTAGVLSVMEKLGDLLRAVVADERELIPLEDELVLVRQYLAVERVRFPDRLSYDVVADDAARCVLVPTMILQPLVENAVVHGVAARQAPVAISIQASVADRLLRIVVHDDGPGPRAGGRREAGEGVGLENVRRRLATIYGNDASCTLDRSPAGGTDASISMPVHPPASRA